MHLHPRGFATPTSQPDLETQGMSLSNAAYPVHNPPHVASSAEQCHYVHLQEGKNCSALAELVCSTICV